MQVDHWLCFSNIFFTAVRSKFLHDDGELLESLSFVRMILVSMCLCYTHICFMSDIHWTHEACVVRTYVLFFQWTSALWTCLRNRELEKAFLAISNDFKRRPLGSWGYFLCHQAFGMCQIIQTDTWNPRSVFLFSAHIEDLSILFFLRRFSH